MQRELSLTASSIHWPSSSLVGSAPAADCANGASRSARAVSKAATPPGDLMGNGEVIRFLQCALAERRPCTCVGRSRNDGFEPKFNPQRLTLWNGEDTAM